MKTAAEAGAALVAAHPYDGEPAPSSARLTQRFAHDESLRGLAHRFKLFNREQLFGWVAEAALPAVATGDFHHPEHLVAMGCRRSPARAGLRLHPFTGR